MHPLLSEKHPARWLGAASGHDQARIQSTSGAACKKQGDKSVQHHLCRTKIHALQSYQGRASQQDCPKLCPVVESIQCLSMLHNSFSAAIANRRSPPLSCVNIFCDTMGPIGSHQPYSLIGFPPSAQALQQ
ncbi:uncharacterized protein UHOD_11538 [Ustilago sp. UG-2017b]|nr:uncharacterized protein UHOD_11538 [Ustilago sp. UG-2017b]